MPGEPPPDGGPQVDGDQPTAVNYVEMSPSTGEPRLTCCSSTASRGHSKLARERPPLLGRPTGSSRSTCRASATARCRGWRDSIESYGRLLPASATRSGSATASWSETRWAASSRPRPRSRARQVREAGAGVRGRRLLGAAAAPAGRAAARMATAAAPLLLKLQAARHAAATGPLGNLKGLFQRPRAASPRAAARSSSRTAPAGPASWPPSRAWSATTSSTSSTEVDVPTLIVWGRDGASYPAGRGGIRTAPQRNSRP